MHVEELRNEREWEDFVHASPEATFYDTTKWKKIIEESFGFMPAYLVIKDQEEVVGVCPGFVTAPFGFRIYTSLPNSDCGGPLFNNADLVKGMASLYNFLTRYCIEKGISHAKLCFLRDAPKQFLERPFICIDRSKGIVETDLKAAPSGFIWSKLLSSKIRTKIKHFERDGFEFEEMHSKSGLREFYSLYRSNMSYIHAPAYSQAFFENIWNVLSPEEFRVWLVKGGQSIGGSACFVHRQKLYLVYAGINREVDLSRYNVAPYMCWMLIKWAEEHGLRYVSMGSTPSDPEDVHHQLKMRFGAEFLQQDTALISFNYNARTLLFARRKLITTWKTFRSFLPAGFKTSLERRLFRLL